MSKQPTFRIVDGERIPGLSRPAFVRNGDHHYLVQLGIYADGLIDCWELLTLEEFAADLRRGRIVTRFEEGARAAVHETVQWEFSKVNGHLTPESLYAEIRDDIDDLNGRPDSTDRAWRALHEFRADPTEERRAVLRAAYEEIPEHERHAALADHSVGDGPLYDLAIGPGGDVTPEEYQESLDYFDEEWGDPLEWLTRRDRAPQPESADGSVLLHQWHAPGDWPEEPGPAEALRNEYPAPIRIGDVTYPSVHEAWQAIDPAPEARTAVMAALLRAKYDRHPALADILTATGSARILYRANSFTLSEIAFWGHEGDGRNWMGRLLEAARAELHARRLGLPH
ncbi:NADAR family protein [Streptomyces sp. NPDC053079]|uniref:NADAR family protein n=1 Tax=Streptomyces sp. NPDC053079 TaxID=3365697 RepID=UPI0037CFE325